MELKAATERMDGLRTVLDEGKRSAAGSEIELFVRESARTRVSWTMGDGDRGTRHDVREHGSAVRVLERAAGCTRVGFAATTGSDPAGFRWALARAHADRADTDEDPRFADGGEEGSVDVDEEKWTAPDAADLRNARDAVLGLTPAGVRVAVDAGWIETGRTAEWLVSSRGVRAIRRRVRTWILLECVVEVAGVRFRRPLIAAARGTRLPGISTLEGTVRSWTHAARDAEIRSGPVEFGAAAAGLLVRSLGTGPGVVDRPSDPSALFGGTHDDCGFPTGARPGLWRGSFRDPPVARPAHLVVEPRPSDLSAAVRVEDLRIHRVEPATWILEGIAVPRGRVRMRVDPRDLPGRMRATTGATAVSHHGVTTPGLVFDLS